MNSFIKVSIIALGVVGLLCIGTKTANVLSPKDSASFVKVSAMVSSLNKKSGGSAVILSSKANESILLTNKHICQLIQVGGLVITEAGEYPVYSYRVYDRHDLCLIKVLSNLGVSAKVALGPPELYTESVVVGHPALLPAIVTRGHFAKQISISIMIGFEPCDGTEEDEDMQYSCMFSGRKPIIRAFESQVVTSLIMAGSSGSGVFNEDGELSGLIFAGGRDGLSYGFIVPYQYLYDFLSNASKFKEEYPKETKSPRNFFETLFTIKENCNNSVSLCRQVKWQSIVGNSRNM